MSSGGKLPDVVVKLGLANRSKESTVFRRLTPQQLKENGDGPVSVLKKNGVLLFLALGEEPQNLKIEDFDVSLTYVDRDGDTVLIDNSDDLIAAMDEWADSKKLKVFADVKTSDPKKTKSRTPSQSSEAAPMSVDSATQTPGSVPAHSTRRTTHPATPIQDVMDSLVGILASATTAAADAVHSQLEKASSQTSKPKVTQSYNYSQNNCAQTAENEKAATANDGTNPSSDTQPANDDVPAVDHKVQAVDHKVQAVDHKVQAVDHKVHAVDDKVDAVDLDQEVEVPPNPIVDTSSKTGNTIVDNTTTNKGVEHIPFIHGRHTCDSCLTTPIVGKRFHAITLADYDLCEACMKNYKGKDIKFEEVELDRDRIFQARWQRRHAKWDGRGRRGRCGQAISRGGSNCGRRVTPALEHAHPGPLPQREPARGSAQKQPPVQPPPEHPFGPPPHEHPSGPPPHGHPFGPPPHGHPFGPPPHGHPFGPPPHGHPFGPPPHGHPFGHGPPFGPPAHFGTFSPHHFGPPLDHEDSDPALMEAIRRSMQDLGGKSVDSNGSEKIISREVPSMEVEEIAEVTHFSCVDSAEDVKENSKDHLQEAAAANVDKTIEQVSQENPSLHSAAFSGQEDASSDKGVSLAAETISACGKTDTSNTSFALDAAGYGEVAEGLGETLDMIGNAIDDVHLELNRTCTYSADSDSDDESDIILEAVRSHDNIVDAVCTIAGKEEVEQPGTTIVESSGTKEFEDVGSQNSWDIVADDQIRSDEAIARAAQVLGSALFNSDMGRSHGNMSTLSADSAAVPSNSSTTSSASESHMSSVTSVPSTIPSLATQTQVTNAQRERWSRQLRQLHELGFLNDALNVDILERLSAANIGVDLMEEVTVQQVINEMMKDW